MIDLALGVAHILIYRAGAANWKLAFILDLDKESNIPSWYSSIQWFSVAALLGLFAFHNFSFSQRKSWLLMMLPTVFLAFSMDEVAQVHEWLGTESDRFLPDASRKNILFSRTGIWMFLIGVPFLALFIALILSLRTYFRGAPGALVKMLLGMAIFLAGAIGIETLANFVVPRSLYFMIQVFSEELCEMLGSTIVLWGSYELLYRHGFAYRLDKVETTGE
ncbi:MAG: hypothetical protein WD688_07405 [Candidatus Binatia bacterium]